VVLSYISARQVGVLARWSWPISTGNHVIPSAASENDSTAHPTPSPDPTSSFYPASSTRSRFRLIVIPSQNGSVRSLQQAAPLLPPAPGHGRTGFKPKSAVHRLGHQNANWDRQILGHLPSNTDASTIILSNKPIGHSAGEERLLNGLRGIRIRRVGLS